MAVYVCFGVMSLKKICISMGVGCRYSGTKIGVGRWDGAVWRV